MPPKQTKRPGAKPPVRYETVATRWGTDSGLVEVFDSMKTLVGLFPLNFLQEAGADVMKISYLIKACKWVLDVPTEFQLVLADEKGPLGEQETIPAGALHLNGSFPMKPGPEGKSRVREFVDTQTDTVSASSRSTANQTAFKMSLLERDQRCLITKKYGFKYLIGCHIVPNSLGQDKVDEITKSRGQIFSFSPKNGLSLIPGLHKAFDMFEIGIYVHEGVYYVHALDSSWREHHGQVLQWYNPYGDLPLPDARLLDWHYAQCMKARFRGFSVLSEFQRSLRRRA